MTMSAEPSPHGEALAHLPSRMQAPLHRLTDQILALTPHENRQVRRVLIAMSTIMSERDLPEDSEAVLRLMWSLGQVLRKTEPKREEVETHG